jgi:hypothetical protein
MTGAHANFTSIFLSECKVILVTGRFQVTICIHSFLAYIYFLTLLETILSHAFNSKFVCKGLHKYTISVQFTLITVQVQTFNFGL